MVCYISKCLQIIFVLSCKERGEMPEFQFMGCDTNKIVEAHGTTVGVGDMWTLLAGVK